MFEVDAVELSPDGFVYTLKDEDGMYDEHELRATQKRSKKPRTEKQQLYAEKMKGISPKQFDDHVAKIHEAGQGRLGPKLLALTELSVSMPPVGAPKEDLLHWAEKLSSVILEFKLDGCNEGGLRAEADVYTPWEKLGVEEQLNFARKAHELMSKIGLDFLSGRDPKEGEYYGIKWLTSGQEDLATLLGYYLCSETGKSGNDCIKNGYGQLNKRVNGLGSTEDSGTTMVRMFKGPAEVHVYHHTLRPGKEFSNKLTQKELKGEKSLSAPLGFELDDDGKFVWLLYAI